MTNTKFKNNSRVTMYFEILIFISRSLHVRLNLIALFSYCYWHNLVCLFSFLLDSYFRSWSKRFTFILRYFDGCCWNELWELGTDSASTFRPEAMIACLQTRRLQTSPRQEHFVNSKFLSFFHSVIAECLLPHATLFVRLCAWHHFYCFRTHEFTFSNSYSRFTSWRSRVIENN